MNVSKIDIIKNSLSLYDVLSYYNIEVNNHNFCLCPFHEDNNPSLKIMQDDKFYCFVCHQTGDVIDFIMKKENFSYTEVFNFIQTNFNIDLQIKNKFKKRDKYEISVSDEIEINKNIRLLRKASHIYLEELLDEYTHFILNKAVLKDAKKEAIFLKNQHILNIAKRDLEKAYYIFKEYIKQVEIFLFTKGLWITIQRKKQIITHLKRLEKIKVYNKLRDKIERNFKKIGIEICILD